MISFTVDQYCEDGLMITRHETIEPPVQGLPPNYSSTLTMKKSELLHLINILQDYVETE
jgi:hypothetical protein